MVTPRAALVIAATLGGCVDTSLTGPFRAEVLVRTPDREYVLQTVALPDLTGFAPLSDPIARFSDHPNFDESELESFDASSFELRLITRLAYATSMASRSRAISSRSSR